MKFTKEQAKEQAEAVAKLLEFLVTRDLAELLRALGYENMQVGHCPEFCGAVWIRGCDCETGFDIEEEG